LGDRIAVVSDLFQLLMPVFVKNEDIYMRESEVRMLRDEGHTIGGHTHRHMAISKMDESERHDDLVHNVEQLHSMLEGAPIEWFSFPFGDERAEGIEALCAELGIKYGFTMNRGYVSESSEHMKLERVDANDAPAGKRPIFD